jgi:membrane protease YdiL (CAAX protease family)
MLSERPWKVEAVAGLLVVWVLSVYAAGLLNLHLAQILPGKSAMGSRVLQFLMNTFTFQALGFICIHVFLRYQHLGWEELIGFKKVRWKSILAGLGAALIALPVALAVKSLCAAVLTKIHVPLVEQEPIKVLQVSVSVGQRVMFALSAIVFAPIVEESLFRGILYPAIKQEGFPRVALFGSSFLFALIHFNLMDFIPLFVLALILVMVLEATDTLLSTIVAHASFNAANFFIYLNSEAIAHWWRELVQAIVSINGP